MAIQDGERECAVFANTGGDVTSEPAACVFLQTGKQDVGPDGAELTKQLDPCRHGWSLGVAEREEGRHRDLTQLNVKRNPSAL